MFLILISRTATNKIQCINNSDFNYKNKRLRKKIMTKLKATQEMRWFFIKNNKKILLQFVGDQEIQAQGPEIHTHTYTHTYTYWKRNRKLLHPTIDRPQLR